MAKSKKDGNYWNRIGVSQAERFSKALLPDYVQVDERTTADLLAFSSDFARLIRYYDIKNNVDGDWEAFLIHDVSVFLSIISITDIQAFNEEEQHILETLSNGYGLDLYKELYRLFDLTHRIISTINKWYIIARELNTSYSGEPEGIEIELEHAIENELNDYFVIFRAYEQEAGFPERLGKQHTLSYTDFSPIWDMEEVEEHFMPKDKPLHERISVGVKKIRVLFRRFHQALSHIVFRTKNYYIKKSITENSGHQPHVAMLITFMELFGHAKEHINEITTRHLDYYYYKVLRQTPNPLISDKVHLHFKLAHHLETALLPQGTVILSNEDDNVIFATDDDLILNKARISELKTVFIARNPLIGIGSSFKLVSDIYSADIANSKDGLGKPFYQDEEPIWATFGERQYDKVKKDYSMMDTDMGFAISSPVLIMKEGKRKVNISFNFDRPSGNTLYRLIKDISRNNSTLKEDSFHQIFKDGFLISITTKEGWLSISDYEISQSFTTHLMSFSFEFTLDFSAPSIQVNPKAGFNSDYPIIRFLFNNESTVYPFSFVKDLILNNVNIDVDVKGVKELVVYNESGRLDASQPFELFGFTPRQGSYLLIGNEEIFQKQLLDLEICIDWFNPPKEQFGFMEYYQNYNQMIDNDSFQVLLSVLSDNKFFVPKKTEDFTFPLFSSNMENGNESVAPTTIIRNIPIEQFGIKPEPGFKLNRNYDNGTRSGFFKLELCNPPMAFGHEVFSNLITKVSQYNNTPTFSGLGIFQKAIYPEPLAIPKEPYDPIVKKLSIDYKASARINLNDVRQSSEEGVIPEKIFHIHPFGNMTTFEGNRASNHYFIPQYDDEGNLFIGLQDLRPLQEISFYFELKENLLMDAKRQRPQATWYYLSDEEWKPFLKKQILVDTTENFTTSGIIKVETPKDISKGGTLLNPTLFWMKIGVRKNVHLLAKCIIVETQGVSASRVLKGEKSVQEVKKDTLVTFPKNMSNIQSVHQPFPSFGGRPAESAQEFYFRVSERLRHKSRAITTWDFERLVLQHFPEIHQVKCISISQGEEILSHSTVKVVVVPQIRLVENSNYFEPKADYFLLSRIKEFLEGYCSPFATLEVMNPVYEKLKISCGVIFTKGNNNGTHLEKLNMEIRKFINPWMFGVNVNLQLGGTLVKDELLTLIQRLPYVKFITSFSIVQVVQEAGKYHLVDTARDVSTTPTLQASNPWTVLVPSLDNPLSFLERHAYQEPRPATVDTLMIGTDFVIHNEEDELSERADYYISNFMGDTTTEKTDSGIRYFLDIPLDFSDDE